MKKKKLIIWILIAGLLFSGCTPASKIVGSNPTPAITSYGTLEGSFTLVNVEPVLLKYEDLDRNNTQAGRIIEKINIFSDQLTQLAVKKGGNLLISPFSVYMTLACLITGTKGETYDQLKAMLYPEGMNDEEFQKACGDLICMLCNKSKTDNGTSQYGVDPASTLKIQIASLICGDKDMAVRDDFALRAKEYFNADTAVADFSDPAATEAVNEWARQATQGLIEKLFSKPIDSNTVLLLANSLYFEGLWEWKFNKGDTTEDTFHGASQDKTASFMQHDGRQQYCETLLYQATRQYYYGGAYMDIFLPKEGVTNEQILQDIKENDVNFKESKGLLKLPKFDLDNEVPLKDALKMLHLDNIFTGGITNIAKDGKDLFVSNVFQKTRIEVDEVGTKAAAVTVMEMAGAAAPMPDSSYFEMIVNRPFVYRICADTAQGSQTLFVGVVNNLS